MSTPTGYISLGSSNFDSATGQFVAKLSSSYDFTNYEVGVGLMQYVNTFPNISDGSYLIITLPNSDSSGNLYTLPVRVDFPTGFYDYDTINDLIFNTCAAAKIPTQYVSNSTSMCVYALAINYTFSKINIPPIKLIPNLPNNTLSICSLEINTSLLQNIFYSAIRYTRGYNFVNNDSYFAGLEVHGSDIATILGVPDGFTIPYNHKTGMSYNGTSFPYTFEQYFSNNHVVSTLTPEVNKTISISVACNLVSNISSGPSGCLIMIPISASHGSEDSFSASTIAYQQCKPGTQNSIVVSFYDQDGALLKITDPKFVINLDIRSNLSSKLNMAYLQNQTNTDKKRKI